MPEHPFDNGAISIRDEQLAPFPRTKKAIRTHLAEYYAIISHMDEQIGRVLDALKRSAKQTILMLFSHRIMVWQWEVTG